MPEESAGDPNEDWLSNLRSGNETKPVPEENDISGQSPLEENQGQDMPDWLARIRERAKVETGDHTGETGDLSEAPDWMSDLRDGESTNSPVESSGDLLPQLPEMPALGSDAFGQDDPLIDNVGLTAASEGEEEWVNKLSAWQAGKEDVLPAAEEFPDWLGGEAEPAAPHAGDTPSMQEQPETSADVGLPDFFAEFTAASAMNEFKVDQSLPEEESAPEAASATRCRGRDASRLAGK